MGFLKDLFSVPAPVPQKKERIKSASFSVAGVTFSNDSGKWKSRQTILKKIFFSDPPFDSERVVTLERYLFECDPAYYVKINNHVIGNVPAEFVSILDSNSDRTYEIREFEVYGSKKYKSYGAELKVFYTSE